MILGRLIDQLCDRLKVSREEQDNRIILKDRLNLAYREIANLGGVNWKHLERTGAIVTIPNYTTGTATVTKDSRTVTFSGSTITSAMVGRYFKAAGSSRWYRINYFVSSSEVTLDQPIQEDSGSGKTFSIWKRFYRLPSEVRRLTYFSDWANDGKLEETTTQRLSAKETDLSVTGTPEEFILYGADEYATDYTTGTVTGTKDTNVLTGSGTSWLDNVEAGDIIEASSQVLRVKRVESNTRIILLNYLTADLSANTYTARKDANLTVQLFENPSAATIVPYIYQKRAYDMVNEDYDRPELPEEFDLAILDGAFAMRLGELKDDRWATQFQVYSSRIQDLKVNRFLSQPKGYHLSPRIKDRGRYI